MCFPSALLDENRTALASLGIDRQRRHPSLVGTMHWTAGKDQYGR